MGICFIHTADWQIGKTFGGYPAEEPLLRDARLTVVDRIAAVAAAAGARQILVAGDVFDSETTSRDVLRRLVNACAAYPDLTWRMLPGNHDPDQPGGVWRQLAKLLPPGTNIHLHLDAQPVEIEPDVLLLPAPLKSKAMSVDPTSYMDAFESAPGVIRIGMAHGSAAGFGSNGDANVPILPTRDRSARLDYLALGDWHGMTRISDRTWYSGTPEPDRFKDNDPGFALAVSIERAGATPVVQRKRTALYQWLERTLVVESVADIARLPPELKALGAPAQPVLLKLTLAGRAPFAEVAAILAAADDLRGLVKHLDLAHAGLVARTDPADIEASFTGSLRVVAEGLVASHGHSDDAETGAAARALQLLARFADEAAS